MIIAPWLSVGYHAGFNPMNESNELIIATAPDFDVFRAAASGSKRFKICFGVARYGCRFFGGEKSVWVSRGMHCP
jgi:hypothetical protein